MLCVRELSCRCSHCLAHRWTQFESKEAGAWKRVTMCETAASGGARTRSRVSTLSSERAKLALPVQAMWLHLRVRLGRILFCLAQAHGPAWTYTGEQKTENGVRFVKGGKHMTIRYYERFPPTCATTFKLSIQSSTVDAEGIIAISVPHTAMPLRRSSRHQSDAISRSQGAVLFRSLRQRQHAPSKLLALMAW